MKDDVDGVKKTNSFINLVQFSLHLEQGGLTLRECCYLIKKMMPNSWTSCTSQLLFSSSEETRTFCYSTLGESALQILYIKRTKFLFQWNLKPFTTCGTKAFYIGLQCLECDLTLSYSVQIYGKKIL